MHNKPSSRTLQEVIEIFLSIKVLSERPEVVGAIAYFIFEFLFRQIPTKAAPRFFHAPAACKEVLDKYVAFRNEPFYRDVVLPGSQRQTEVTDTKGMKRTNRNFDTVAI